MRLKKPEMKLSLLILFFTMPALAFTQEVVFEAFSDAKEVPLNGYFEVSFTLKNANGSDFNPPDFKGFVVLAGPSTSSSMQIINGKVSREMSYLYTLKPSSPGKLVIGSATIKANGKRLSTKPLTIEAVKGGKEGVSTAKGEVFVRLEPSKKTAFVGEQLLLDYKLYTTASIDGYDIAEEPEYEGFYAQELRRYDSRTQREVVRGKQFTTKVLRRIALFPQQTGTLTISPLTIQLSVVEDDGGGGGGFFFNRNVKPVLITTDPVNIDVKTLPADAPETFSGAVGVYEYAASVNRNMATTDDAVTVTMLISGNGDLKRVEPPVLLLSDSLEVYAPKVVEEQINENQGELTGKKVIEYLVLPKYPGNYTIKPAFSWFDVHKGAYETRTGGPFQLQVRQGSDKHRAALPEEPSADAKTSDIRFIKIETDLQRQGARFVGAPLFWVLTAFPVLAFIGVFFYKQKKAQAAGTDGALLKSKLAAKEAQKRLATAHQHLQANNTRAFYDEISKAALGFVCDKARIPLSALTKENVRERLQTLRVSPALIEDFMQILQTCEMALFAGMDNATAMQATYDKAVEVITGIEKEIPAKA